MPLVRMNQAGSSIVPILMISALLSAVVAGFVTLYDSLNESKGRSDIRSETDQIVRYVQNLLMQPGVCREAFRTGSATMSPAGSKVAYAGAPVEFDQILAGRAGVAPQVVLHRTQIFGEATLPGRFQLTRLRIRPFLLSEGPPYFPALPPVGQMRYEPPGLPIETYTTQPAKVELRFTSVNFAGMGSDSIDRAFTIIVATSAAGTIEDCLNPNQTKISNFRCTRATLTFPSEAITVCPEPPVDPLCRNLYFIEGFDGLGNPICKCAVPCRYPPPPGAPPTPAP